MKKQDTQKMSLFIVEYFTMSNVLVSFLYQTIIRAMFICNAVSSELYPMMMNLSLS